MKLVPELCCLIPVIEATPLLCIYTAIFLKYESSKLSSTLSDVIYRMQEVCDRLYITRRVNQANSMYSIHRENTLVNNIREIS
jgi:two-component SAPR family response regulator